jgi:hypothetical protein
MPASKDVGTNIKNLRASGKKRSDKQITAIALNEAREAGNRSIKPPPGKRKRGGK